MRCRPKTRQGWEALVLLVILLLGLHLVPTSEASDLFEEEMDEFVASHGNFVIDQDGLTADAQASFQEGPAVPLDSMTDEELEVELFERIRQLHAPQSPGPPEIDFGKFQRYHDALADIIDPDGVHPARTASQGRGRKLSIYGLVVAESWNAVTDHLNEKASSVGKKKRLRRERKLGGWLKLGIFYTP